MICDQKMPYGNQYSAETCDVCALTHAAMSHLVLIMGMPACSTKSWPSTRFRHDGVVAFELLWHAQRQRGRHGEVRLATMRPTRWDGNDLMEVVGDQRLL
jgi:hypothetical protein